MQSALDNLPDDPVALKAMIAGLVAENSAQKAQHAARIAQLQQTIHRLELHVTKLRRRQFGQSSERSDDDPQLSLMIEDIETQLAEQSLELERLQADMEAPAKQKPARRRALPKHLPRVEQRHACDGCPGCGGELRHVGDDVSEVLDVVPASYRVIQVVRPKYSCDVCDNLVQKDAPSRVLSRGMASANLIAQVLVDKYADHLPLYRQEERFMREELDIDRSTLAGWVGRASYLLSPLADAIRNHVLAGHKVHGDDTTAPTLKPGNKKTLTGRYWNYVRDDRPWGSDTPPAVWFQYSTSRIGKEPMKHLKGFRGILQADAYAGYNGVVAQGVTRAGCWAHVRRKFYDLMKATQGEVATEAIRRIDALYAVERAIRGKPPDERQATRQQVARPQLDDLATWFREIQGGSARSSPLNAAVSYALKQWDSLVLYLDDGRVEIDNNAAERAIRPLALGRKNHLFAGSEQGGINGAVLYSLMGTAKLNGMDPRRYLTAVLKRIGDQPVSRVDELLPWNIDLDASSDTDAI